MLIRVVAEDKDIPDLPEGVQNEPGLANVQENLSSSRCEVSLEPQTEATMLH